MKQFNKSRFSAIFTLFITIVAFSFVTRTILLVKALSDVSLSIWHVLKLYIVGLFFDAVTFSYFAIPFVLVVTLLPDKIFNSRYFRPVVYAVAFLCTYLLLFDVVAEYTFFDEFATRFNFIAVDYLIYTNEVIDNIRESYPVNAILGGLLVLNIALFLPVRSRLAGSFAYSSTLAQRAARGVPLLILPVVSFLCVDLSLTNISSNNYVVELAGNGIYCLFSAFRNNELDFNKFYINKENNLVQAHLKKQLAEPVSHFDSPDAPGVRRMINAAGTERRMNVILVVEESMSADFMKAFGNDKNLTPNLDKLAKESLFFSHLYATGTRTVRGLEALTLSMPPLPGTSIVKRPKNEDFISWGSVLKGKGYDNKFIYAGHGYFDNMNYFYDHNGFRSIDRTNFSKDEITFTNAWGVCDEDLFNKVIKEADLSTAARKPFFSVVMTTSNHRPFTYPDGKIDVPSHSGRHGGVKYADYAVGKFLADAHKKSWFNNTIFVIVADHCAGSAAKVALPIKNYEIPLFIYAPALVKPRVIDRMMSQIDVAPTVLGLMNMSYNSAFIGKNILTEGAWTERAFISTYQKLGYVQDNAMVILGPKRSVEYFTFDRKDGATKAVAPREDLLLDALGYIQGVNYIYKNRLNRLP